MKKLKHWLIGYYRKRSVWSLISDAIFFILIILLLIPVTRKEVVSRAIRLTMRQPAERSFDLKSKVEVKNLIWPLRSVEGKEMNFTELEGEVIFLNFWATWCPPCIAEMPAIQSLYDEYGDRVVFLLVTRENPETVKKFLESRGFSMPVYIQEYQEPGIFRSNSIPATYIVSREGRLVLEKKGAAKWNSRNIRELMDGLLGK